MILLLGLLVSIGAFYYFTLNSVNNQMDYALTESEKKIDDNFNMILREIKSIYEVMESLEIYKANDDNMVALLNSQKTLFADIELNDVIDVSLNSLEKYTIQDLEVYFSDAYLQENTYYFDLFFQWRDRQVITFKVKYDRLFEGLNSGREGYILKVLPKEGQALFVSGDEYVSDETFDSILDKKNKSIGEHTTGQYFLSYTDMAVFNHYLLIYVPVGILYEPLYYFAAFGFALVLILTLLIVWIVVRVNRRITGTLKKLEDKTVSVDALETMGPLEISTYQELSEIYMNFFSLSRELKERDRLVKSIEDKIDTMPDSEKHEEDKSLLIKHNTYLKQSIDNLQANQERLVENEKLMALGDLVSGIAHEISTPVGVSYTSASYMNKVARELKEVFENDDMTKRQFIDFLNASIESSAMICNNLEKTSSLVMSFKNDANTQTSVQLEEFELCHLIKDVYEEFREDYPKKSIDFRIDCEGYINMYSDAGKYRDIFTNLMMNALIHGFDEKEHGQIVVDINSDDKMVYIQFKDDGKGIEDEYIKKIYDPFFTTKRGKGGSGLGLNIVYTLVKNQLKGDIRVESAKDAGTAFFIEFPKISKI